MSAVPLSQKLVVLCMLARCQHPLTSEQIDVYMMENHWSDYMLVQQLKAELVEAGFVTVSDDAPYFYMITSDGTEALNLFISAHMPPYVRNQVENFVADNRARMLNESTVFTDVQPQDDFSYCAHLRLYEGSHLVMDLRMNFTKKQDALALAKGFRTQAESIREKINMCAIPAELE